MENNILRFNYVNKNSFEDIVSFLKEYTEEFSKKYRTRTISNIADTSEKVVDNVCGNLIYKQLQISILDDTLAVCKQLIESGNEKEASEQLLNKDKGLPMFAENLKKLQKNAKMIKDFEDKKSKQGSNGNKIFSDFINKTKEFFGNEIGAERIKKYFYDNCLQKYAEICERNKIQTALQSFAKYKENIKRSNKNKSNEPLKKVSVNYPKFEYKKQTNPKLTPIINACEKYIGKWRKKYGQPGSDFNMHLIYDYLNFDELKKSIDECKDMITDFKNKKSKSENERTAFLKTIRDKLSSNGIFTTSMSLMMVARKSVYIKNNAVGSFKKYYENKNNKTESQFDGDYKDMIKSANRSFSVNDRNDFVENHLGDFISIVSELPSVFNNDQNFVNCVMDINNLK